MFKCRGILALAFGLLLFCFPVAHAAEGDTMFFRADSEYSGVIIERAVAIDDTVYFCTSADLFTYKLGDTEPAVMAGLFELYTPSDAPAEDDSLIPEDDFDNNTEESFDWRDRLTIPFEYQGKLHMIHELTGTIVALENGKFVDTGMKINPPDDLGAEEALSNRFVSVFGFEDKLYVLTSDDIYRSDAPLELWIVDPEAGEHKTVKTQFPLYGVCAYKSGKLLGLTLSVLGGDGEEAYPRLFVLDAATGKTLEGPAVAARSGWRSISCPLYDEKTDSIYYALGSRLLKKSSLNAEPEAVNYFDRELSVGVLPMSILSGSHLVVPSLYGDVYIRDIRADTAANALKIAGHTLPEASGGFMSENPDIPIEIVDTDHYPTAEEIARSISAGEDSIDIYINDYDPSILRLFKKGYALDLSGSEAITRALDRMYEDIREIIVLDEKALGFPFTITNSLWSYNAEKFEELGLEYPETFSDFLDLLMRWNDELKDECPSINFTSEDMNFDGNYKQYLIDNFNFIDQYVLEFSRTGEPLKFDTPEFREIMRKLDEMPDELSIAGSYNEANAALIDRSFALEYFGEGMLPANAPRISRDSEAVVGIYVELYIVNPNSANADKAIRFLEYMADHSDYTTRLAMYPDFNDPLLYPSAELDIYDAEKNLAEVRAMEVTDENRRDVEQMIKDAELEVERQKTRWRVSPEAIEAYRAVLSDSRLSADSGLYLLNASKEITDLFSRYVQKQITLDKLISELDQKAWMMYLEQQ